MTFSLPGPRQAWRALAPIPLLLLAICVLPGSAAGAASFVADIDPAASSISGVGPLSGQIRIEVGALPLAGPNESFDVVGLGASAGSLAITLDPDLAAPGLGVLGAGSFLIPSLFLRVDDGMDVFDLTVSDVAGSFRPSAACGGADCLETAFQIDTLGAAGVLDVVVVARVPEPAVLALLLGAAGLAWASGGARASRPGEAR